MHAVTQCPCCSYTERSLVAECNRLLAIPEMRDSPLMRYDYMLCHGCGLVYASMRPDRKEYELLYENFNEFGMQAAAALR